MSKFSALTILFLALSLIACESGLDQRYLDASQGGNLELPPDLDELEIDSRFELPQGISGDDPTVRDRVPVLAKVDSIRLEGSGDLYWLSVEEPVENLYQLIRNFWAITGYRLVVDEPVIGLMQTEWIFREIGTETPDESWFTSLFSSADLSAVQDQFRTRIERDPSGKSRIYIVHRGTEYIHIVSSSDTVQAQDREQDNDWHVRQSEPELEIEMLSRLMVYLGLQRAEVDQQVAGVKLFSPSAGMHIDVEENSPFLVIKDAYHLAWNRIFHQLERMNFEILGSEFRSGISGEGEIRVSAMVDETPDEEKKSGFFSFFSSSEEPKNRQFVLVFIEETHEYTRVILEAEDGEFDTSPAGAAFLKLLYQNIR